MVGDGVLDDLQQLLLRVGGTNGETVKQLHHQTSETLESSGNANGRIDLDQDSFGGVNKNLEATCLVHGGIKQGEQTLRWVSRYV